MGGVVGLSGVESRPDRFGNSFRQMLFGKRFEEEGNAAEIQALRADRIVLTAGHEDDRDRETEIAKPARQVQPRPVAKVDIDDEACRLE